MKTSAIGVAAGHTDHSLSTWLQFLQRYANWPELELIAHSLKAKRKPA